MLNEKEESFIKYWESNRMAHNSLSSKLMRGLPMAMLFSFPIILFVIAVYLYFPEWYTKVSGTIKGSLSTILTAVVICIVFFSYFRMHFKWEMNEQLYQELLHKKKKSKASLNQ
jgi:hypothetical protein